MSLRGAMSVRDMVARATQHDTLVCRRMCEAANVPFKPVSTAKQTEKKRSADESAFDGLDECFNQRYGVAL